ncbi:MAG: TetR/AcrR family transcriptional regulator [Leptospira sp.]|nr:TetR/AcrR family transcriptional regulator [Leptospira sp.]
MSKVREPRENVRTRIINTAERLFREQGFRNTGINQIVTESETAKASFYQYFASKEELGRAYLEFYGGKQLSFLRGLTEKYRDPVSLTTAWVKYLKRGIKNQVLFGCPMANLRAQTGVSYPDLDMDILTLTNKSTDILEKYLSGYEKETGKLSGKNLKDIARKIFACYEGTLHIWRLTGDENALDDFPELTKLLITS